MSDEGFRPPGDHDPTRAYRRYEGGDDPTRMENPVGGYDRGGYERGGYDREAGYERPFTQNRVPVENERSLAVPLVTTGLVSLLLGLLLGYALFGNTGAGEELETTTTLTSVTTSAPTTTEERTTTTRQTTTTTRRSTTTTTAPTTTTAQATTTTP